MRTVWRLLPEDPSGARALAEALGVQPVTAQLLINRGQTDAAAARAFLHPSLDGLAAPDAMPGVEAAVTRLRLAQRRHEPVVIFGDSDVDGLTATAILFEALRAEGVAVTARHSNRIADGYGLAPLMVDELLRSAAKVVILVDCGTNQPEAVNTLAAAGIDTIIVDHHVPMDAAAEPLALINPFCDGAAWRELSSAGLAFKLAHAIAGERIASAALDLAALGTLADCSPIRGESRILIACGMARIVETDRPGLRRLCRETGTSDATPEHITRKLVPRLNASGRLGAVESVWHVLIGEATRKLDACVADVAAAHAATKRLHRQVVAQAHEQLNQLHFRDQYVLIVSRQGWPQGVMGPVASQLAERFNRPALAVALNQSQGTGSGRSIPEFNLLEALTGCREWLTRFGGHAQACGLSLETRHLESLRGMLNERAAQALGRGASAKTRVADIELPLGAIRQEWVVETEAFAPFGRGNPRPMVLVRGVWLERRSPRTGVLRQGDVALPVKGTWPDGPEERMDAVVSPVITGGELTLALVDAPAAPASSRLGQISDTRCTPAPA